MAVPSEPVLFPKFPSCIIGTADPIIKPKQVQELDYEVELVIVIGREGKNIKESNALDHIAGYTVGNVKSNNLSMERYPDISYTLAYPVFFLLNRRT